MGDLVDLLGKENIITGKDYEGLDLFDEKGLRCCLCPVEIEATAKKNGFSSVPCEHDTMQHTWASALQTSSEKDA